MTRGHWQLDALCRKKSDHKPLFLRSDYIEWGPKSFKVFNCWLKEDSLKSILYSHLELDASAINLDAQSLI